MQIGSQAVTLGPDIVSWPVTAAAETPATHPAHAWRSHQQAFYRSTLGSITRFYFIRLLYCWLSWAWSPFSCSAHKVAGRVSVSVQQQLRHGHGRALLASRSGREPLRGAAVQHPIGRVEALQSNAPHLLLLVRVAGLIVDLEVGCEATERVELLWLGLLVQLDVAAGRRRMLVWRARRLGRGWRRGHCRRLGLLLAHSEVSRVEALARHDAAMQKRRGNGGRLR